MKKNLLIITGSYDIHATVLIEKWQLLGNTVELIDTANFLSELSFKTNSESNSTQFKKFDCIWWRKPFEALSGDHTPEDVKRANTFRYKQVMQMLNGIFLCCERGGGFVLDSIQSRLVAEIKPYQLMIASEIGFTVPNSIISASKIDLLNFFDEFSRSGGIITKLLREYGLVAKNSYVGVVLLKRSDLEKLPEINNYPIYIQEQIKKSFELRITVVGKKLFAVKIDSQSNDITKLSWKDGEQGVTAPLSLFALPSDIEEKCFELCRQLKLQYAAIDMAVTPEGQYVFFEVNPNGQYYWQERVIDVPITNAVADLLMNPEENRLV